MRYSSNSVHRLGYIRVTQAASHVLTETAWLQVFTSGKDIFGVTLDGRGHKTCSSEIAVFVGTVLEPKLHYLAA